MSHPLPAVTEPEITEDAEIQRQDSNLDVLRADVQSLTVTNAEQNLAAASLLGRIRDCAKALKDRLEHHLKPFQDAKRGIDTGMRRIKDQIEPRLNALDDLRGRASTVITKYNIEQQRLAKIEQDRIDEENRKLIEKHQAKAATAEAKGKEAPPPPVLNQATVQAPAPVRVDGKTTYTVQVPEISYLPTDALPQPPDGDTFERVATSKIPDEYWILDEVKIGKLIRAGGKIPGVQVTMRTETRQRG